jgi:hypothetical protein
MYHYAVGSLLLLRFYTFYSNCHCKKRMAECWVSSRPSTLDDRPVQRTRLSEGLSLCCCVVYCVRCLGSIRAGVNVPGPSYHWTVGEARGNGMDNVAGARLPNGWEQEYEAIDQGILYVVNILLSVFLQGLM